MPSALISVSGDGIERCISAAQLYFCYFEKPCWQTFYTCILLGHEAKTCIYLNSIFLASSLL